MKTDFEQFVLGEFQAPWTPESAIQKTASKKTEKKAGVADFLRSVQNIAVRAAPVAATAAIAGLGAEVLLDAKHSIMGAVRKSLAFRGLIRAKPELAESMPAEKLREHFNTLYRYSPTIAHTPQVAASWIRQMSAHSMEGHEYIPPEALRDLVSIEKDVAQARMSRMPKPVLDAFTSAAFAPPEKQPQPRHLNPAPAKV